jgi:hypothetical protein
MTPLKTFAVCLLLVTATQPALGQMFVPTGRDTLRGLPGVEVIVENLEPELERHGLTTVGLRTDIEAQLRKGGVTIYPSQTANPSAAKAYLYVEINALALPDDAGYALGLQVHLRQTLRSLVSESNIVNAMTWDAHNVLAAPTSELHAVRGELATLVDEFIADWSWVH